MKKASLSILLSITLLVTSTLMACAANTDTSDTTEKNVSVATVPEETETTPGETENTPGEMETTPGETENTPEVAPEKPAEVIDSTIQRPEISTVSRVGKGDVTVKWKQNTKVTGYQIAYGNASDYSDAKIVKVSKNSIVKKALTDVSTKKDTFVRIRCYKKGSSGVVFSKWSHSARLIVWKSSWPYAKNSKIHTGTAVKYYTTASAAKKKNITVCINAGHGTKGGSSQKTLCHPDGSAKVTGGSTGSGAKYATAINEGTTMVNGTSEAAMTLKVAKYAKKYLLSEGFNVVMIRQGSDVQLDNIARTVIANKYADFHVSIHYDSTASNKGAFAITVPDNKKYRSMEPVKSNYKKHNKLAKCLIAGLKNKGIKIYGNGYMALDLTQTSYSTIPSVDLEVGDRKSSRSTETMTKLGKGITRGIKEYLK